MKISLQIILMIFSLQTYSQVADTYQFREPETPENLNGRVKSITEQEYFVIKKFGKIEKDGLSDSSILIFNPDGTIKEKVVHNPGSETIKHKFTYDKLGHLLEKNVYSINNKLWYRYIYKTNKHGKITEEVKYHSDGSFSHKYSFEYNDGDQLVKKIFYESEDGSPALTIDYKYNEKGQKINEFYESSSSSYDHSYDENGNLIETKLDFQTVQIYQYDKFGNIIECIDTAGGFNHKLTNEYKYDFKGNWIMKTSYNHGKAFAIVVRI